MRKNPSAWRWSLFLLWIICQAEVGRVAGYTIYAADPIPTYINGKPSSTQEVFVSVDQRDIHEGTVSQNVQILADSPGGGPPTVYTLEVKVTRPEFWFRRVHRSNSPVFSW